jgi:hypothetical protein
MDQHAKSARLSEMGFKNFQINRYTYAAPFIGFIPVEKPPIKDVVFIELEYLQFTRHYSNTARQPDGQ